MINKIISERGKLYTTPINDLVNKKRATSKHPGLKQHTFIMYEKGQVNL